MMLGRSFLKSVSDDKNLNALLQNHRQLNKQKLMLNREKLIMKKQQQSSRKQRTRTLIQLGGLVQKSGLMELLEIAPGDNLQDFKNLHKASRLLGFLLEKLEQPEVEVSQWQDLGERHLRYINHNSAR